MSDIHVDVPALRAALDATRQARGLSWREVARQVGISASTMSRMAQGHYPDVNAFVRVLHWLGMPHDAFVVNDTDGSAKQPALLAQIAVLLRSRPDLNDRDEQVLIEAIEVLMRVFDYGW